MRILTWHVHGSWTTSFVHGPHTYLLPVVADRGPDGRGRAETWDWPAAAVECTPEELAGTAFDVVLLQRPHELELLERWTGRRAGSDVPAVYVEHDTPRGPAVATRHPLAGRSDIPVVHVTHFNAMAWDTNGHRTRVVQHGILDPGVAPYEAGLLEHPWPDQLAAEDVVGQLAQREPQGRRGRGDERRTAEGTSQGHRDVALPGAARGDEVDRTMDLGVDQVQERPHLVLHRDPRPPRR